MDSTQFRGLDGLSLIKNLGQSSMSPTGKSVHLIHDQSQSKRFVIKIFEPETNFIDVERESDFYALVEHPRIVKLCRTWNEPGGRRVFAFPWLGDLKLDQAPHLSLFQRIDFLLLIIDVVQRMHQFGYAHRNITTEHIVLDAAGPILIGFGNLYKKSGIKDSEWLHACQADYSGIRTLIEEVLLPVCEAEEIRYFDEALHEQDPLTALMICLGALQSTQLQHRGGLDEPEVLGHRDRTGTGKVTGTVTGFKELFLSSLQPLQQYLPASYYEKIQPLANKFLPKRTGVDNNFQSQLRHPQNKRSLFKKLIFAGIIGLLALLIFNIVLAQSTPEDLLSSAMSVDAESEFNSGPTTSDIFHPITSPEPITAARDLIEALDDCFHLRSTVCLDRYLLRGTLFFQEIQEALFAGKQPLLQQQFSAELLDTAEFFLIEQLGDRAIVEGLLVDGGQTFRGNLVLQRGSPGWQIVSYYSIVQN